MVRPICWMMTGASPSVGSSSSSSRAPVRRMRADRQHLLLAAGKLGALAEPSRSLRLGNSSKIRSSDSPPAAPAAAASDFPRRRGWRKCRAPPGRTRCRRARSVRGSRPISSRPSKRDRAGAVADDAHDRLQRRGLAGAVAAEQRHHLARMHVEIRRRAGCATRRTRPADPHRQQRRAGVKHGRRPYRLRALRDCSTPSRSRPRPARGRASAP